MSVSKVGRNDLCPCGSGKKFKKCCLGKAMVSLLKGMAGPGAEQWSSSQSTTRGADLERFFTDGYKHFQANNFKKAARVWLQLWTLLKDRLEPTDTTLEQAQRLVSVQRDLLNWSGDMEQALHNGSLKDRSLIPLGREFFRDWLEQFSEEQLNRLNTHNALVEFTMRDGDVASARELLEEMIRLWPDDPWTHIFYADAYCHLFADQTYHLPFDRELARRHLQRALELSERGYDRDAVQQRLDDLEDAKPRSETCSCCPH